MKDIIDVAAYILGKVGDVSTMKLQKLAFYSQAYSLVSFGEPLFGNRIEAWANGPVVPDLFRAHKGRYVVNLASMDFAREPVGLDPRERRCVEHVVERVGGLSGAELSQLTHSEGPWLDARAGLAPGERCASQITDEAILAFYSSPEACSNRVFAAA